MDDNESYYYVQLNISYLGLFNEFLYYLSGQLQGKFPLGMYKSFYMKLKWKFHYIEGS
jgi:hypothetical protein